ncbi:MAG TPA: exo-beta-N-acetylmuramidase NamZ domain-containing protein, partial [Polyangiaceae bacterium]|nr:exo-beta-N-acetylmuramidase NamZ domain-containing protein [Polyangiaceae bacterium]
EKFLYSDAGFIVLGEIVRRVSGSDVAAFAKREIWDPLGMSETMFLPTFELKKRAAPTEQRDGAFMIGDVHDPRAYALGGVAGHAGLFSTAADLSRFARAMLGRGELDGHRIFSRATADLFFTKSPSSLGGRTLGWDAESIYAKNRAKSFSPHAFGHGGFTGTALWIDPDRDLFVLFLSNRVHPDGKGAVNPLVADLGDLAVAATDTATGLDVLREDHFKELAGARVGLVTNTSARGRDGKTAIDAFEEATEVKLTALFSPEHGISADRDALVADSKYGDVPIYSLYGDRFAPSPEVLHGLDAIVFDLQDAGVRFYTYASTMRRAMKVASDAGLRFVVLDRPNPLDGVDVQGPIFSGKTSFVNNGALPVRHGMTMGELARLFAAEDGTGTKLEIVKMKNWRRDAYYDATGLQWTSPSPNLRSITSVVLYPALGLVEGTNVSVGRGTEAPFERLGAPWIDGGALSRALASANLPGVAFAEATFAPESSIYKGEACHGVRVAVTDRAAFDPIRTGVAIAIALSTAYPTTWRLEKMEGLLGDARTLDAIRTKRPLDEIVRSWEAGLAAFKTKRGGFLLY